MEAGGGQPLHIEHVLLDMRDTRIVGAALRASFLATAI